MWYVSPPPPPEVLQFVPVPPAPDALARLYRMQTDLLITRKLDMKELEGTSTELVETGRLRGGWQV